MRRCVWCDAPLPAPAHKGHRRREYCDNKGRCKQQMYLFHKKMKEDAERLADPYWKLAYEQLVYRYTWVEERLLEERLKRSERRSENDRLAFRAKLRALGMSDRDIQEFEDFWLKASDTSRD
jgi:hypothetical protein